MHDLVVSSYLLHDMRIQRRLQGKCLALTIREISLVKPRENRTHQQDDSLRCLAVSCSLVFHNHQTNILKGLMLQHSYNPNQARAVFTRLPFGQQPRFRRHDSESKCGKHKVGWCPQPPSGQPHAAPYKAEG